MSDDPAESSDTTKKQEINPAGAALPLLGKSNILPLFDRRSHI